MPVPCSRDCRSPLECAMGGCELDEQLACLRTQGEDPAHRVAVVVGWMVVAVVAAVLAWW